MNIFFPEDEMNSLHFGPGITHKHVTWLK